MSDDHCEEQEMEAEALTAIFDDCIEIVSASQPFEWVVTLWPEQHHHEGTDGGIENHVGIRVRAIIPYQYPDEGSPPQLSIEIVKGLTEDHAKELLDLANDEATANAGMPAMYAICERLREWLIENNVKGMDDLSMYAQMMKREKEKEREGLKAQQTYEAQKRREELTEAESEDLAVRRRRAEGTPCTDETFTAWRDRFDAEMEETARTMAEAASIADSKNRNKGSTTIAGSSSTSADKAGRLTGYQQFSDRTGTLNLEAIEAAAENAPIDEDDDLEDVDEDLFDDDDDLDDIDFDDDEEEGEDDNDDDGEDEPDI